VHGLVIREGDEREIVARGHCDAALRYENESTGYVCRCGWSFGWVRALK
jgi:hypothetical protein